MEKALFLFVSAFIFTADLQAQVDDKQYVDMYPAGLSMDQEKDAEVYLFVPWDGIEIDIPNAVSLEDFVPNVRSQGTNQNSGGWAVGYYLASTEWALNTNQSNKAMISTFAYDPLFLNNASSENATGCDGEVFMPDLFKYLVDNGAKRLNIDQADCETMPEFHKDHSILNFDEVLRLTGPEATAENNLLSVKYNLASYHPVVFSMHIPESFQYVAKDGLFRPSEDERKRTTPTRGHALTIVGYDDELYGGAFRVVNSWGTEWGDNGYCWITYEDFQIFQEAAFMVYTELKVPDLVKYGAEADGFGRKYVKKHGFFEGYLDHKGRPEKGIYMNEQLKKGRGGSRYMRRLIKKNGGFLVYSEKNFKIPVAAVIY